jgi:hypothetical protein
MRVCVILYNMCEQRRRRRWRGKKNIPRGGKRKMIKTRGNIINVFVLLQYKHVKIHLKTHATWKDSWAHDRPGRNPPAWFFIYFFFGFFVQREHNAYRWLSETLAGENIGLRAWTTAAVYYNILIYIYTYCTCRLHKGCRRAEV